MFFENIEIIIVFAVLIFCLVSFVKESYTPDVVALIAMAVLLATGILSGKEVLSIFSNSGPISVAALFILNASLERTGCIASMGKIMTKAGNISYLLSLFLMMIIVVFMSAFMNNTPIVVFLTPVMIILAKSIGVSPSKYLMPLSYAAILGGTCTLIGTSTNILVDGIVRNYNIPPIGMFEITQMGVIYALIGIVYVLFIGQRFLPDYPSTDEDNSWEKQSHFFTEILVPPKSSYIKKTLAQAGFSFEPGKCVIDVIRQDLSLRYDLRNLKLQAGDRIVLETNAKDLIDLRANKSVSFDSTKKLHNTQSINEISTISTTPTIIMQGIVGPRSKFAGKRIKELNIRQRFGSYIIAVHKHDEDYKEKFDEVELTFGDTVLIEGPEAHIRQLFQSNELISLTQIPKEDFKKSKSWIAILTILGVMTLSAFEIMPISSLAIIGSVIVLATGCIQPEEAYSAIDWRIIFLIFGMLALSMALEKTQAAEMMVTHLMPLFKILGPIAVLALIYGITSLFTELISNNAVALLFAPIAINIAEQMQVNPRPFLIAVMFGASACFSTPIGYQTNTFVYSAGRYKFIDFIKVGVPLNLILFAVAVLVIPLFWSF